MKRSYKKLISALLLVSTLLSVMMLSGCNTEGATPEVTPTPSDEIVIPNDNYRNWYEIFVYSYFDTDNDGIGDINGVIQKLDYIKDMGFTGIWLMPIHPSPTYHKYDVNDYYAIDPTYGTLDDLKRLVDEAHKRDIKVILDLVVNHTSINNKWFTEACGYIRENGAPGGEYGDYYNFTDKELGQYSSVSGTEYYYESRFWSGMPDLNLDSTKVREEIVNIMKYWLSDYGVDGFRLDAVTSYYTGMVDKNIEFLRWLGEEAKKIKPECYIVGEAWEGNDYQINRYYESGIDSFFLFTGAQATGTLASLVKSQSGATYGKLIMNLQSTYTKGISAPFLGNHDTMRPGSFMPGEDNVKMACGALAMMSGATFVYYGEEIGMISKNGNNSDPAKRIAMHWMEKSMYPGKCYLPPENTKVDETSYYYPSVEEQMADPDSILNYYKQAMWLRNRFPEIARGTAQYFPEGQDSYICVMKKTYNNKSITIVMNFGEFEQTATLDMAALGCEKMVGELYAVSTDKAVTADGKVTLPPHSIVIYQ